jgi:hypothetical protein
MPVIRRNLSFPACRRIESPFATVISDDGAEAFSWFIRTPPCSISRLASPFEDRKAGFHKAARQAGMNLRTRIVPRSHPAQPFARTDG